MLVGGLYALAFLGMMSIGIYILVIAIVTTILVARRSRVWPEIIGLATSPAAAMLWIAFRAWALPQCGPGERDNLTMSASGSGSLQSGTYSETVHFAGCTSLDAGVLMWSGILLVSATLVAYIVVRFRKLPSSASGFR